MKNDVEGYMCKIDWDHEIGTAHDGNRVYPSLEALQVHHTSWKDCGVVKVSVNLLEVLVEGEH